MYIYLKYAHIHTQTPTHTYIHKHTQRFYMKERTREQILEEGKMNNYET